jgi:hypothetical protein
MPASRLMFVFVALVILAPLGLAAAPKWVPVQPGATPDQGAVFVKLLHATPAETVLEMTLRGYWQEESSVNGTRYRDLTLGEGWESRPGKPHVPVVSRLVALPWGAQPAVEVLEDQVRTLDGVTLLPAQPRPKRCGPSPKGRFTCDAVLYAADEAFPAAPAQLADLGVFRDLPYARLTLNPVQFRPGLRQVTLHTRLRVRLSHDGQGFLQAPFLSPGFVGLYRHVFANWKAVAAYEVALPEVERVHVVTPQKFEEGLAPFVAWKRAQGFTVDLVTKESVPISGASSLKSWLQARYNNLATRPDHVILVGDIADMPSNTSSDGGASDFIYSQLAGGDLVSDVLVSRLSVKDAADLAVQTGKAMAYESSTPSGEGSAWLGGSVVISSSEGDGQSNDDVHGDRIAAPQSAYGYSPINKLYYSQGNATVSKVSQAVNEGRGFITYFGHGSGQDWSSTNPPYDVGDVSALVNDDRLPLILDVSCSNGEFDVDSTCFAEAWMRATHGGQHSGAVGIYSSTTTTAWDEPAEMAIGAVTAFLEQGAHRWGEACLAGRLFLEQQMGSGDNVELVFQQYVVFGDSTLLMRSRAASELLVDAPTVVPVGELEQTIMVTRQDGSPVQDALVHLYKEAELDLAGYTDAEGRLTLLVAPLSPGDIALNVTAFDSVPWSGTISAVVTGCGILKARPDVIPCDGALELVLWDQDLNGDPEHADSAKVTATTPDGQSKLLTLTETDVASNQFTLSTTTAQAGLALSHGTVLSFTYDDADCEGAPVTVIDTVAVDCQYPIISGVHVAELTATKARVVWATDEPAEGLLQWGQGSPDTPATAPGFKLEHEIKLTGLTPATSYVFQVQVVDAAGNTSLDDNGGELYGFTTPECTPDCTGRVCGDDGCGGSCGTCDSDQECDASGKCQGGAGCVEQWGAGCNGCKCEACVCAMDSYCCTGAWDTVCVGECQNDCGGCGGGQTCQPQCEGKQCGPDQCGGVCGKCGAEAPYCDADGLCSDVCLPSCEGKQCGDNGCGGVCGKCGKDEFCAEGLCVDKCSPHPQPGCPGCACEECVCAGDPFCCDTAWDDQCVKQCVTECGGCNACAPSCDGKQCGPDGCGGVCGFCGQGQECDGSGQCQCVPDCEGRQCGPDGCGGSCGECTGCDGQPSEVLCQADGSCAANCCPSCEGKACDQDDGCGSLCGCPTGQECRQGECVGLGVEPLPEPAVEPVGEVSPEASDETAGGDTTGAELDRGGSSGCALAPVAHGSPATLLLLLAALVGLALRRRVTP